ncbi:uncharacterized protein C16orf78 homolog isoform X2 [Tachyglossus aculeatus]|uniref:uncharacterized protein C16orf78 homolog isoform X2 n=1 Tax=Tachyglossus aculeatus TaxID=9261 RepID=UPI0018F43719|nr:uncharacterized protein C16orf78 homolog isoform X2 [Tachyglossus aculeatus]
MTERSRRTSEERRLSDATRVLEWLERRRNKAMLTSNKKESVNSNRKGSLKWSLQDNHQGGRDRNRTDLSGSYTREARGSNGRASKRASVASDQRSIKESSDEAGSSRQSSTRPQSSGRCSFSKGLDPNILLMQDAAMGFPSFRKAAQKERNTRGFVLPDSSSGFPALERRLKDILEKREAQKRQDSTTQVSMKPEEILSCRYLRLSKNNIKTLLKLCKDAGMNVEIHPHMTESELNAKTIFNRNPSISL